jgi:hypothetical protein
MKASMVDMDANAANDLLGGPNGIQTARDTYNTDRAAAVAGLIRAAKNITYPEEEPLIQTMENGMSLYAGYVAQAQLYNKIGDSASAIQSMKMATDLMHQQILPAADQLDSVNFDHLATTYANRKQTAGLSLVLVLLAGAVVLGLLVVVQVFVARRTRRMFNVPLVGATLVALLLGGRLVTTLNAETTDSRSPSRTPSTRSTRSGRRGPLPTTPTVTKACTCCPASTKCSTTRAFTPRRLSSRIGRSPINSSPRRPRAACNSKVAWPTK